MENKDFQLDLQELVENHIWTKFTEDFGFFKRLFHRRYKYYFDIPWGFVDFSHETTTTKEPSPRVRRKTVLHFSEFENMSLTPQKYTFSTERSTTATKSIQMQENYTIGGEANLEIDLGGVVKVGGGINGSLSVTNTKGEEFSETLKWNINTEINVPAWNTAGATLYVDEEQSLKEFKVTTTISLNKGHLPVSIRRIKDNNIVKTYWITNLSGIFTDFIKKQKNNEQFVKIARIRQEEDRNGCTEKDVVVIVSRGVCKNQGWKNQRVELKCSPVELKCSPINRKARSASL